MQDNYGRDINYLRLSITDSCNYRCIYCMDSDRIEKCEHNRILSIDELINIGRVAVSCGISKIRITGGEPLIRDGIMDLCRGLKSINGLEELAVTTNGARLSEMARDLKASGVDRLNISLDTLNEEKYKRITRTGRFKEVLKGIDEAVRAGFDDIKINVVLMAGINDDEINDFIDFTRDRKVSVRFIELMPLGPCREWYDERYISTKEVLKRAPELMAVGKSGVSKLYRLEDALGSVGLISPVSECFCSECSRIRVTADGRLLPCLHSDLEVNIAGLADTELKDAFYMAVKNKPARHHIIENHTSDNNDFMNEIGG